MNRTSKWLVLIIIALVLYLGMERMADVKRQEITAQRVERLASAVERLAENIDRLLREQRRANMADIILTEGVEALNHAQTIEWTSGDKTVKLTVYKATEEETRGEMTERVVAAIEEWQSEGNYPPSVGD
jgi:hypothetical protein